LIKKELILLLIPLILTSFTHLWNLVGFPLFYGDEGTYIRRIFVVLNGVGLQEKTGYYTNAYDHPFFGQLLVGNLLRLSGYPNFAMEQTTSSIELAMAFPRMIMGVFAIIDTFLVFKICQRAYNIRIALFASILFAVTPMTWLIRMITIDNIALPFLLTSILISLNLVTWNKNWSVHKHIFLVLLSGTFLGLAMLTKVPFFTMIPLVTYLIYKNSNHLKGRSASKTIAIWLIPIILIPSIWPLYAISVGEFDLWKKGIQNQTDKADRRSQIIESLFNIDSMLFLLGVSGLIYSFIRKNWLVVLWIAPFLTFLYIHGWFQVLNGVTVLPAFCIAGAKLVIELAQKVKFHKIKQPMALIIICTVISGIAFFNTFILINQNLEAAAVKGIAESLDYADRADGIDDDKINEKITVISPTDYSWIYKYIHKMNYAFDTQMDIGPRKIETNKTLILQAHGIAGIFDEIKNKFSSFVLQTNTLRKMCYLDIEWYKTDLDTHTPLMVIPFENYSSINMVFEANSSSKAKNPERIDMKNTTARYINITLLPNTDNRIGAISEISIYGKKDENDNDCKKIPIKIIKFKDQSLLFKTLDNYDIIASYQKLLYDMKQLSNYDTENLQLNGFTKLFSPMTDGARTLKLKANY
jgi:hypothetical protein